MNAMNGNNARTYPSAYEEQVIKSERVVLVAYLSKKDDVSLIHNDHLLTELPKVKAVQADPGLKR